MNIKCEICQASYRMDMKMFKGSRGMAIRCRRCGKSILVLKPEEIAPDMPELDGVGSEGDRSGNGRTEPAVSPAKEDYSPPLEAEIVPAVEKQTRISQEDPEEEEFLFTEARKKAQQGSVQPYTITGFYPSFPESPPKNRHLHAFISTPIVGFVLLFVLLVGVPVSLVSPSIGKRVFNDLGKGIEEVGTIFGS
jgi:predicted Zn finger-like uncharacterized protein